MQLSLSLSLHCFCYRARGNRISASIAWNLSIYIDTIWSRIHLFHPPPTGITRMETFRTLDLRRILHAPNAIRIHGIFHQASLEPGPSSSELRALSTAQPRPQIIQWIKCLNIWSFHFLTLYFSRILSQKIGVSLAKKKKQKTKNKTKQTTTTKKKSFSNNS